MRSLNRPERRLLRRPPEKSYRVPLGNKLMQHILESDAALAEWEASNRASLFEHSHPGARRKKIR